eukprot:TRINITY_DN14070_c0_g1_i1.p2 TRINITY_DN14070_c0_g1~~TRINITY_DN14070_c0_g1_i1.p2  ORF type:complete len:173 (+),score=70.80 TRINITY_DN14070_c0_g1_i1:51-521(+)
MAAAAAAGAAAAAATAAAAAAAAARAQPEAAAAGSGSRSIDGAPVAPWRLGLAPPFGEPAPPKPNNCDLDATAGFGAPVTPVVSAAAPAAVPLLPPLPKRLRTAGLAAGDGAATAQQQQQQAPAETSTSSASDVASSWLTSEQALSLAAGRFEFAF